MRLVALVMLIGCGRIGFDATDASVPVDGIVPNGLVAYYPMETIDSTGTDDATGRGHRARCGIVGASCPPLTAGRIGAGFLFTGNERLEVDSTADLLTTSAFTISIWLESTATPIDFACAATKVFGAAVENAWTICLDPSGNAFFGTVSGSTEALYSPVAITHNVWHHVTVRWTGSMKTIWIDAVAVTSFASSVAELDGQPISIGADLDLGTFAQPFVGRLDELRIYNRALSDGEIMELALE